MQRLHITTTMGISSDAYVEGRCFVASPATLKYIPFVSLFNNPYQLSLATVTPSDLRTQRTRALSPRDILPS